MQRPESIAALGRSYYHTGQKQKARGTLEVFYTNLWNRSVFFWVVR
jgi:hypothetical protein